MVFFSSRTSFAGIVFNAVAPQNPESPKPRSHRCHLLGGGDRKKLAGGMLRVESFVYSEILKFPYRGSMFIVAQRPRPEHDLVYDHVIVREQALECREKEGKGLA